MTTSSALEIWYQGVGQVWYMSNVNIPVEPGSDIIVIAGVRDGDVVQFINGDAQNRVKVVVPQGIFDADNKTKFTLAAHGQSGDRQNHTVLNNASKGAFTFKFKLKNPDDYSEPELDNEDDTNGQILILDGPDL